MLPSRLLIVSSLQVFQLKFYALLNTSKNSVCAASFLICIRCVGRVYGADGAAHGTIRTVHTTYATVLKTTTHPKSRCRKPYAASQHLMLLMMDVSTRNMSN